MNLENVTTGRQCNLCGEPIKDGHPNRLYCSSECQIRLNRRKRAKRTGSAFGSIRQCILCGDEFMAKNSNHVSCPDPECKEALARISSGRKKIASTFTCEICGETKPKMTRRQKQCKTKCIPVAGSSRRCSCCGDMILNTEFYDYRNDEYKAPTISACKNCMIKRASDRYHKSNK